MLVNTTAIILAGGRGERLRPVLGDLPKCLAPIAGAPFLDWLLRSLSCQRIERYVLSLGFGADQVIKFVKKSRWYRDLDITYITEEMPLGTGGAVSFAMDRMALEEALIVNGDTFISGSFDPLLRPLDLESNELLRVAAVPVVDRRRFGGLTISEDYRVTGFSEKGLSGAGLINAGVYRIHRQALAKTTLRVYAIEQDLMPILVTNGLVRAGLLKGSFIDIGVPDDYRQFNLNCREYFEAK
jgi:D-glycero-alpha-D-manno-heptose 1-phosphate guanylyltransferase